MWKLSIAVSITLAACSKPADHLAWVDDDFVAARAAALERGLPVFVEVTADW